MKHWLLLALLTNATVAAIEHVRILVTWWLWPGYTFGSPVLYDTWGQLGWPAMILESVSALLAVALLFWALIERMERWRR